MTTVRISQNGHERRTHYEERDDGAYDRIEESLMNDGTWRAVGHEVVDDVEINP